MLTLAIAGVVMAGCGGGGGTTMITERDSVAGEFLGNWELVSPVTPAMVDAVFCHDAADSIAVTFNPDGTIQAAEYSGGECIGTSFGTWSVQGDVAVASWASCEETFICRVSGSAMTLVANEGTPEQITMNMRKFVI